MEEAIEEDKRSVSASVKRRFIKDAEVVERAFGKKYEERFTQLVHPAYVCTSKYSYLRVLVAFFKVMRGHEEQAFSRQQLTQHPNAVSSGSKRALGEPVSPDPKKQRLGGAGHLTRSVQDGSMPQVRCTVEGGSLSQETTYIPNNILPPNQTPSHEELNRLQYYREIPIPDTNSITVVYRWGGGPALRTMREGCSFNRDQEECEWYWAYIVLDLLPFSFLKEFIKQSDVWKEENRESSETQCVQLCMYQRPESAYCYLYCIVPKAVVSECRGSYDTDPAPL
ncbi:hypothetical protein TW65_06543 [Stemphylium lycopersici]|uniref:Uncharacterized protein n=1 Tax=Stemphylium lycopersici TaxID=183478 RepID=A0A364MS81_STELY|nr:hypothetical protein TW65_06543 [Stemphylium lycopersici]RAR01119.1 hypothetical protein DDE83_008986 [Stemphylium lycopersici]